MLGKEKNKVMGLEFKEIKEKDLMVGNKYIGVKKINLPEYFNDPMKMLSEDFNLKHQYPEVELFETTLEAITLKGKEFSEESEYGLYFEDYEEAYEFIAERFEKIIDNLANYIDSLRIEKIEM